MKTEVYSWRVSADLKEALEDEASRENTSLAKLLDKMARQWIKDHETERLEDEAEQRRLHAITAKFAGALDMGGGPYTNQVVHKIVVENLAKKYGRRKLPR
jgi:hypothetical protein